MQNKLSITPDKAKIAAFDDLIAEKDVSEKLDYSKSQLRRMRQKGTIKHWFQHGKKIMYSKTELANLLQIA